MSSSLYTIETGKIEFTAADMAAGIYSKSIGFVGNFTSTPIVTLTPVVGPSGNPNVNVFVSNIDTSSMTVNVSGRFTGEVHYQAIQFD